MHSARMPVIEDEILPAFPSRQNEHVYAPGPEIFSRLVPLPVPPQLIGRAKEMQELCSLLERSEQRLLVLCGIGGVGKTCLALQAMQQLGQNYPEGRIVVPLAHLSDPSLLLLALSHTLGLRQKERANLFEGIVDCLGTSRILLMFDTFEHMLPSAMLLLDLLRACPQLHVLLTSRTSVRLQGACEYSLGPLALPTPCSPLEPVSLLHNPSIALFMHDAHLANREIRLNAQNAQTVIEICRRLDGIPLALRQAAAQLKRMTLAELLAALSQSEQTVEVLSYQLDYLPQRQQTMRANITWCYQLLTAEEQTLFRRLAAFTDGCSLDTIETICARLGGIHSPVLECVTSLLNKGLVHTTGGPQPHLKLLEMYRLYALELLQGSDEIKDCLASKVDEPPQLTKRELEVLRLMVQGSTNVQVARHLVISPRTVNIHVQSIYSKLAVSSRVGAVRYAIEHQLLTAS